MRVCFLSADPYRTDPRLVFEARSLAAAGHEVVVLCRGGSTDPGRELADGIDVDRLPVDAGPFDPEGTPQSLSYAATTTVSAWESGAKRIDEEGALDAICVRGFPLAKTGLDAGEDLTTPVALDFAADPIATLASRRSAAGIRALAGQPGTLASRALTPIRRLRRLESKVLDRADRLIVASEEARARYLRERDRPARRVRVVRSTIDLDAFDTARAAPSPRLDSWAGDSPEDQTDASLEADADTPSFRIVAPGPIVPDRGFETLLDATARLADGPSDPDLLLVGEGVDRYVSALHDRADEAGIGDRVRIAPPSVLPAALDRADVSVLPYPNSTFAETALPYELFASFGASTPVVAGDVPPLRRVLARANAGLIATDSATDIAAALRVLERDSERAQALGNNGRRACEPDGPLDAARDRAAVVRAFEER